MRGCAILVEVELANDLLLDVGVGVGGNDLQSVWVSDHGDLHRVDRKKA